MQGNGVGVIRVGSIGRKQVGKCPAGLQWALLQVKARPGRRLKLTRPHAQRPRATAAVTLTVFSYRQIRYWLPL